MDEKIKNKNDLIKMYLKLDEIVKYLNRELANLKKD